MAITMTTFDLTTKITAPVEPDVLLVAVYSIALSPIPLTGLAFVIPKALLKGAANCSGETALALLASG